MKKVYVLQHFRCEDLGSIQKQLILKAIDSEYIRGYEGAPIPNNMNDADGLVIMGGPMGVYDDDKYPFLRNEKILISNALESSKPILGICLGSQLLASVLGAKVYPGGEKEIGWFDVTLSENAGGDRLFAGLPSTFTAFHWHGDIFDLPRNTSLLARSDLTAHQAFRYGVNAYGLLFHLEVTGTSIRQFVAEFEEELSQESISGEQIVETIDQYLPGVEKSGDLVFSRWVDLLM